MAVNRENINWEIVYLGLFKTSRQEFELKREMNSGVIVCALGIFSYVLISFYLLETLFISLLLQISPSN